MFCCSRSLFRAAHPRDRTTARGSGVITANTRYRRGWPCSRTTHQRARDPRAAVLETPRVRKSAKDLRVVREDRAKAAREILGDELRRDTRDRLGLHQEQEPFNIIGQRRDSGQAVDPHMYGLVKVEVDVEIDEWDLLNLGLGHIDREACGKERRAICAGTRCREHGHRFACPSFARRGSIRGFHAMVQGRARGRPEGRHFDKKKAKLPASRFRSVDQ